MKTVAPGQLKDQIRDKAAALGFDAVHFTGADLPATAFANFEAFAKSDMAGDMDWLLRNMERRAAPKALWPACRSVIVLGVNYGPHFDPLVLLDKTDRGNISVYARGDDYHDVIKKKMKQLARWVGKSFNCDVKVFVDTAPVLEKPLAMQAGLGWQGKHTNLVSRRYGSWLFLAEIFTTLEMPPDEPEQDHCGSCSKCLDICPTKAFPAPYKLDARRCISYLTIEHKGDIPVEFRKAMGNRIYGCDDCLAVCPWNKFAEQTRDFAFLPRIELTFPKLMDLVRLDDAAFRRVFSKSPIKRLGRERFVRNVLIALGNSQMPEAIEAIYPLLSDPSALVRAMAVWALGELATPEYCKEVATTVYDKEEDQNVRREWSYLLRKDETPQMKKAQLR